MQFNPLALNAMLNLVGQEFMWRPSIACPCVDASLQPGMNCPHCAGKGRIWSDAVPCKAAVAGRNTMRRWQEMGQWDSGDMVLSIPSDSLIYGIGQFDRLASINASEPFSLALVPRLQNGKMPYPVAEVHSASWINGAQLVTAVELPTVDAAGVVTWGAQKPPAGATFTLTGRRRVEYFVYREMPGDRPMHSGATLPRKVVLRRFDLFGR